MKIKYSTIAMSRKKNSSFRTAERVWKTLFKANVTVLLLVLINNVNISRLNWIGRQLQPVELAAGELAVNWQTTSAWFISPSYIILHHMTNTTQNTTTSISLIPDWQKPVNLCAWTIMKKTEWLPWIIAIIPYFSQFFWKTPEIAEIPVFAGHPSTSCNTWLN